MQFLQYFSNKHLLVDYRIKSKVHHIFSFMKRFPFFFWSADLLYWLQTSYLSFFTHGYFLHTCFHHTYFLHKDLSPHKFTTKTAKILIKLYKLFFTEIWNFSTWQIFLHKYDLWYLWQIWALIAFSGPVRLPARISSPPSSLLPFFLLLFHSVFRFRGQVWYLSMPEAG